MPSRFTTLLAGALALSGFSTVQAQDRTHRAEYSVSLLGLPVADAAFDAAFSDGAFRVSGEVSSAGLANVFSRTAGSTSVAGAIDGNALEATAYRVDYTTGSRARSTEVVYRNGAVVSARMTPERKREGPDWVAITEGDMRAVIDPISGLLVREGDDVCGRVLPVFDGESRMDFIFSPVGTQPFTTEGLSGEAIVCSVRFTPRAGFWRNSSTVAFLQDAEAEIWFALNPAAGFYAPVYARVPTKLGPVTVRATRFGG
jgi:hypothetical protein